MSAANLINLNVDTLFEQHSVQEIDVVHKKIQAVVENKREELRTMVGERYRDLLQAADTIGTMKESSSTLISQVDDISTNCRNLNEQTLIGFKTGQDTATDMLRNRHANKQLNNYFSTMVQIKLLTTLPELIWSHIDQEHFFVATELFIFSRHISTGLQLDAHNPLMQHLPVAKKQWEILKPFHVTIKQKLISVLVREELTAEAAADCLLSLLLLEKINLNNILNTFLQHRSAAFLSTLNESERAEGEKRRLKHRILASLKVLTNTIELMAKCFLDDGLLFRKFDEYSGPTSLPTIALMDADDAQFSYMLPDVICNFHPNFSVQQMDHDQVRVTLEQWLTDNKRIADEKLKQLLDMVTNVNTIQEIKAESLVCCKHYNFAPISDTFKLNESLDFYERLYVPLINQRIRDIIHGNCSRAIDIAFKTMEQHLSQIDVQPINIWLENSSDLPLSLEEALSEDYKCKKLLMKIKGYDNEIIDLCTELDSKLECVVNETGLLLEESCGKNEDKLALIEFLRETAQTHLTRFVDKVKTINFTDADAQLKRKQLLFVVRVCVALVELCPHLKICFCQQSSWRQWVGNVLHSSVEYWNRMCLLIEQESFHFWERIVDGILEENNCEQYLSASLTHDIVLEDFAIWETVNLEQSDEQDQTVHSTFRIPSQPCISLQSYLFALIRAVNAVVPQTLPSKVLHDFNGKLLRQLATHYEQIIKTTEETTSAIGQNVALQLYFDVKFLQQMFAITRDERALCEQFQALQGKLKECIDPFDFELFAESIIGNVKRSVVRLHSQFGVLAPKLANVTASAAAAVTQEKDPNVLSLSVSGSTSLWFPLLPIVTPSASQSSVLEQKRIFDTEKPALAAARSTTTTATTTTTTAAASVTAASGQRKSDTAMTKSKSFFGAMSQEWFR